MIGIPVRLKTAVSLVLLGLLTLLAGIGQLTFWAPAETITASAPADTKSAPLTVIDQSVLTHKGGPTKISIKGDGNFVLAVGRPDDVDAWVGKTAHNSVTGVSEDGKSLQVSAAAGDAKAPSPANSDLWVQTENANGQLDYTWTPPASGNWSLLVASDGTKPAPSSVSLTFPNDTSMPWAVPLIVIGAILILVGAALPFIGRFIGGNGSGPRNPFLNRAETPAVADGASETGVLETPETDAAGSDVPEDAPGKDSREGSGSGAALRVSVVAAAVAASLVGGAAVGAQAAESPSPSGSSTATPSAQDAAQSSPVLLDSQLKRILEQVASAVAAGDAARDAAKLAPRVDGTEMQVRTQNYKIRSQVATFEARMPVRSTKLLGSVITTQRSWPRTVVAVTQGDGNVVPQVLTLVQASPRDNYKLKDTAPLQPGTSFPAIPLGGTQQIAAGDKTGLQYSGTEAMAALADRLTKPDSAFKDKLVEGTNSPYIADVLDYQSSTVKSGTNGDFTFTHTPAAPETSVFRTSDGGALVIGRVDFTFTSKPKADGDTLNVDKAAAVLAGGDSTKVGLVQNFAESVAIYIPPTGTTGPMKLVAAVRGLVGASFQ
ncbi:MULTISPECIES: DUF2905 domain-containing protein [Arthrobacter]|uniref:DUF2905 domain-containing protein n=1 Tax=Arthrobacter terricola TaxID=2547396 RepID=A0A4R5KQF4_9MICC|nr:MULTISPECIES: DUF2905 domain-containing protein [Arthrobacter]MBT8161127.1 hypothetical protein [Arthrobacter sp. GN70]TDF96977.1 DUF2905 domain-containing protein [Arthrobacter terricola]